MNTHFEEVIGVNKAGTTWKNNQFWGNWMLKSNACEPEEWYGKQKIIQQSPRLSNLQYQVQYRYLYSYETEQSDWFCLSCFSLMSSVHDFRNSSLLLLLLQDVSKLSLFLLLFFLSHREWEAKSFTTSSISLLQGMDYLTPESPHFYSDARNPSLEL